MTHCRTIRHIARLYNVDESKLRATVRKQAPPARREGGDDYYKKVALVDGRMLSIFDGETEYKIGVTVKDTPRQNHGGGIYVYNSITDALNAAFPGDSALKDAEHVIIRVRAEGSYCRYRGDIDYFGDRTPDKLAFARVTPLEIVGEVKEKTA
jgi:hypothetical protein